MHEMRGNIFGPVRVSAPYFVTRHIGAKVEKPPFSEKLINHLRALNYGSAKLVSEEGLIYSLQFCLP